MTDPMTPSSTTPSPAVPDAVLAELARLAAEVALSAPGPWTVERLGPCDGEQVRAANMRVVCDDCGVVETVEAQDYFAALDPDTVRALILELAARRAADAKLETLADEFRRYLDERIEDGSVAGPVGCRIRDRIEWLAGRATKGGGQ